MKKIVFFTLCILGLVTGIQQAKAQNFNASYFMEGMYHRHELNPAFGAERGYVTMPFLSHLGIGVKSNMGLENFIFQNNDPQYPLTTFMSPSVSREEFLGKLSTNNHLGMEIDLPILGVGFRGIGGFNTIGIKLRSHTNFNLPYELFDFMKTGMSNASGTDYSFKDLNIRSNNYVELALGHSHALLNDHLRVGAKVKVMIGGASINTHINKMDIHMGSDQWKIQAQGEVKASVKGAYLKDANDQRIPNNSRQEIGGIGFDTPGIGGFGFGIDLGAVYDMREIVKGLKFSVSILDLGMIKWSETLCGALDEATYEFGGFNIDINAEEGQPGNINHELDQITEDLQELFKFHENGVLTNHKTKLAATLNIGAEYALPYYERLKFGALYTSHFNSPFTWHEGRLSANVAPLSWLEASVSYGFGTFGNSFGAVLNFHPKGFNFFVGTDHCISKVNPQFIPLKKATADVFLGINFSFGKRK